MELGPGKPGSVSVSSQSCQTATDPPGNVAQVFIFASPKIPTPVAASWPPAALGHLAQQASKGGGFEGGRSATEMAIMMPRGIPVQAPQPLPPSLLFGLWAFKALSHGCSIRVLWRTRSVGLASTIEYHRGGADAGNQDADGVPVVRGCVAGEGEDSSPASRHNVTLSVQFHRGRLQLSPGRAMLETITSA